MELSTLTAISPIDGRYAQKTAELQPYFSEYGLLYYRVMVEIRWLQMLIDTPQIKELPKLSKQSQQILSDIINNFSMRDAKRIKIIEQKVNHDVKAVEYFIKEKIAKTKELAKIGEFVHFGCTSEDINNLAYASMIAQTRKKIIAPQITQLINTLSTLAHKHAAQPMLARTHAQPASPTTVGKEFANFAIRLQNAYQALQQIQVRGKFNGAVGNFNAHYIAYPNLNWLALSKRFVKSLGIEWSEYTTQIEPHDTLASFCNALALINTILIDLCRDIWGYTALGYFTLKTKSHEVGSSTMPHKINPIDFENAEGNFGIANALLNHFAMKLPISRWQRDLTDSTVLRNLGVIFSHALLGYKSLQTGLNKLQLNVTKIEADLDQNWGVLAEAIQTVMRRYGIAQPYEKLKQLTRGKEITKESLHLFIDKLELPNAIKQELKALTPSNYIGCAADLAKKV